MVHGWGEREGIGTASWLRSMCVGYDPWMLKIFGLGKFSSLVLIFQWYTKQTRLVSHSTWDNNWPHDHCHLLIVPRVLCERSLLRLLKNFILHAHKNEVLIGHLESRRHRMFFDSKAHWVLVQLTPVIPFLSTAFLVGRKSVKEDKKCSMKQMLMPVKNCSAVSQTIPSMHSNYTERKQWRTKPGSGHTPGSHRRTADTWDTFSSHSRVYPTSRCLKGSLLAAFLGSVIGTWRNIGFDSVM